MTPAPRHEYGQAVRVIRNIRNDGTYPGFPTGALLVRRGSVGYVKDVGTFLQDQVIYSVHFLEEEKLVGCRQEELQGADDPWVQNLFEFGDKVTPRSPLGVSGKVVAAPGAVGAVVKLLRDHPGGTAYHVLFVDRVLLVPETSLDPAEEPS